MGDDATAGSPDSRPARSERGEAERRQPFVDAVTEQLGRHRAAPAAELVEAVRAVLDEPDEPTAARLLLADPPLLAAFFQNVDLLYEENAKVANTISGKVMHALHLLGGTS
jgi:hypothetical protein